MLCAAYSLECGSNSWILLAVALEGSIHHYCSLCPLPILIYVNHQSRCNHPFCRVFKWFSRWGCWWFPFFHFSSCRFLYWFRLSVASTGSTQSFKPETCLSFQESGDSLPVGRIAYFIPCVPSAGTSFKLRTLNHNMIWSGSKSSQCIVRCLVGHKKIFFSLFITSLQ